MDASPGPVRPTGPGAEAGRGRGPGLLIGRPFGVPVYLAPTWFIVAALITWVFAAEVEQQVAGIGDWKYAVSLAFAVLLYLSVLVHELSHTVVALRAGLPVRRISLYLLGGVSEIEKQSPTPGREAGIAVAGPLVSLLLAVAGYGVAEVLEPGTVGRLLAWAVMASNLVVGVFNLLPGLPLDGGRVLAAAVWRVTGQRLTGVVAAAWCGRGVALLVLALPVLLSAASGRPVDVIGMVWGALLGSFIWVGASQALKAAQLQRRIPGLSVRHLTRRAIPVSADMPLAEALRRAQEAGARGLVVVDGEGHPTGLVDEDAARATPEPRRPWVPVGDLARRLMPDLVVSAELTGEDLVVAITRRHSSEYLVVEPSGEIYGILAASDVERAVAARPDAGRGVVPDPP
ncbi:MAG: site-2 protease family protein [Actinomycetes bacterium]